MSESHQKQEASGEETPWLLSAPILPLPARALAETNHKKEEWGGIGCGGQFFSLEQGKEGPRMCLGDKEEVTSRKWSK